MARTWVSIFRSAVHRVVKYGGKLPFVNTVLYLAHKTEFAQGRPMNGYCGIFDSFEQARKSIPPNKKAGYDNPEMGKAQSSSMGKLNHEDYPVLFWLQGGPPEIRTLFDLGGHFGELFYAYRKYLKFPKDFTWRIFDVPTILSEGKRVAGELDATGLQFTANPEDADGADVLLASGSLQYMPEDFLPSTLGLLQKKPRHVIVHRMPLHDEKSFITVQATGPVFCPYTIAHRQTLVDRMAAHGYKVIDSWSLKRALVIPFHPDYRLDTYSGIYFRLEKD
jgi:putative methyltransferase (TIGR04325 family)